MRYLRFSALNLLLAINISACLAGGWWLWASWLLLIIISSPADEVVGDDLAAPDRAPERLLLSLLFLSLPLLALNIFIFAHYFGQSDPFGLVTALSSLGIDFNAARNNTSWLQLAGGFLAMGLYIGSAGTNVAHELVHRTSSAASLLVGRWLLAFSLDTTFSIEHVYGHHRHVATAQDPATARRGENVFSFALRSIVVGNISACHIEAERLKRKCLPLFSLHNRVLTGQFMSLFVLTVFTVIGGLLGALAFLVCAIQGKFYLEVINYIEHYGLVRIPGSRVEARHSWNCYRNISGALLYNLPRHSHHHSFASKPFWKLEVDENGPVLPYGYLTMIGLALVPPLFMARMRPLLREWDAKFANDAERDVLAKAGLLT